MKIKEAPKKVSHFRKYWVVYAALAILMVILLVVILFKLLSISKEFLGKELGPLLSLKKDIESQGFSDVGIESQFNYEYSEGTNTKTNTLLISAYLPKESFNDESIKNKTFSGISNYLFENYQPIKNYDILTVSVRTNYKFLWIIPVEISEFQEYDIKDNLMLFENSSSKLI